MDGVWRILYDTRYQTASAHRMFRRNAAATI
jgi:hypothetical protein